MITRDDLRGCKWDLLLHARLGRGGVLFHYKCREHPRLVYVKSRQSRADRMHCYYVVDGHGEETASGAIARLNRPPEPLPPEAMPLKTCTVWQPWASLIMIGAKPIEFREKSYLDSVAYRFNRPTPGERIVIHAAARPIRPAEVNDLLVRLRLGDRCSLIAEKALPLLERLYAAHKCQGVIPLSAALGTAVIGQPRRVDGLFQKPDSDRVHHHQWAWPLSDCEPWIPAVPSRGFQGFWLWQREAQAA